MRAHNSKMSNFIAYDIFDGTNTTGTGKSFFLTVYSSHLIRFLGFLRFSLPHLSFHSRRFN
ncbi:hypothetical protein SO802_008150, partial [Lithocarpus litseifolius]